MSRHFKDFGASNFGQLFSQLSDNIRSNAEQLVSAALTGEASCRPDPSGQRGTGHPESESSASPSPRRSSARPTSSTSSSQATTPDEIVGNLFSQFSRGGGASSGGSSMGNAGFCSSRHTNTVKPGDQPSSSQEAAAMLCDICSTKFTLFNRKKVCSECKNYFCGSCVSRETPSGQVRNSTSNSSFNNAPRTCKRCKILLSIPPVRADLMELRVKDLQRYLISKKVNTKSCVEKKDLVELVIRQNASSSTVSGSGGQQESSSSSTRPTNPPAPVQSGSSSRRAPEERQKSFPKAYVESTHRHEWLEKMNENANQNDAADQVQLSCEEDDDDFIVVTPVTPMTSEPQQNESENNKENDPPEEAVEAVEETPIEPMIQDQDDSEQATNEQIDENRSSSTSETEQIGASALPENNSAESKETSEKIRNDETASKSVPINIDKPKESNLDVPNDSSLSMSESPRRFANQGLVYLSEIENVADIQDLSVKQAKDILAMNRVNFKGVVEKDELLKHVSRLWKQEKQAQEDKDAMVDSDLCKICMDNPVDCVMLECGHMCTCTTCGKQMAECPICRQYVVRVVRTFKA